MDLFRQLTSTDYLELLLSAEIWFEYRKCHKTITRGLTGLLIKLFNKEQKLWAKLVGKSGLWKNIDNCFWATFDSHW